MSGFPELQIQSEFGILVCILLVGWIPLYTYYALQKWKLLISRQLRFWLLILRFLLSVILLLMLFNLRLVFYEPDESVLSYAVLFDNSGSMNVRDLEGQSRLEFCNDQILGKEGLYSKIRQRLHTIPFAFDEELRALPDSDVLVAKGAQTDIDKALLGVVERVPVKSLGGVLLLTDGNDNIEDGLMRAAVRYQELGVPISVIGVGSQEKRGDIALTVRSFPSKLERGEEGIVAVKVARTRVQPKETVVTMVEPNGEEQKQVIDWQADETEKELLFRVKSYRSGKLMYAFQTPVLKNEMDVTNNKQIVSVEVVEPKIWKVLYLGEALQWEYTFLSRQLQKSEQFQLHALIQKDDRYFYINGLKEETTTYPDFQTLKDYQALLIDMNICPRLKPEQMTALSEYIQRVGGSILFLGPYVQSKPLDTVILDLLPITPNEITSYHGRREIIFKNRLLFDDSVEEKDSAWLKSLFMPEEQYVQKVKSFKLGTQKFIEVAGDENVLFSAHHYGGGKVGFLGLDSTWKWVMGSDRGDKNYLKFWTHILQWQTASAKDPLIVGPNQERFEQNQTVTFTADLLNEKFLPTDNAEVSVTIYAPREKVGKKVTMNHDAMIKGRFTKEWVLSSVGEYRYEVNAVLEATEDGKAIIRTQKSSVEALEPSQETGDSNLKEDLLEDLARVTEGQYWHYTKLPSPQDLPLSKRVKMKQDIYHLNDSFFLIILGFVLLLVDIYLRRKNGMK